MPPPTEAARPLQRPCHGQQRRPPGRSSVGDLPPRPSDSGAAPPATVCKTWPLRHLPATSPSALTQKVESMPTPILPMLLRSRDTLWYNSINTHRGGNDVPSTALPIRNEAGVHIPDARKQSLSLFQLRARGGSRH